MRKLSAEFIEQQNKGNRNYQKFVDITLKDGTVLNLTNKNLWNNGFSFEESVSSPDNFEIGSAIIDKFTVVINNIYDEFSDYIFSGAKAVVYVGLKLSTGIEKIRICTGMVADEPKQRSSIITLQFHSYMEKFDKDYSEVKTVFPATRGQIVHDICSACDVTLQTVTFDRDDYLIQKRPSNDALTCRQMLAWVAQIGCQWAKCDEYGRLCLEWYNTNPTDEETIQIKSTSGAPSVNIEDVVITGVRVTEYLENSSEENPAKSYLYGKEGYVIAISGNKLVTEGTGETIAAMIGEKCVGMKFRPFSASCLTDIAMEAGDPVITTDRKGYAFFSYLTSVTLKPGDFEFVSCGAKSAERSSSKQYTIINQVESEAKNNIHREKTEREKALQDLADRIKESGGAFTTIQKDESGGSIFYLHNKPKLEDSDMVWKMTAEAWGVSTDGGKSWNAGMTVDGDTIVRILTATGVNADWINAGAITVKDSSGNIIFSVNMDTKKVVISGDSVQIGGKTASQALKDASDTAKQALEEARKANNLTVVLDNNFQGIPADYNGNITAFPTVKTRVTVFRGHSDISADCIYSVTKSDSVTGSWDNTKREYTVTGLSADTGWVDITASYMSLFTSTKRFNVAKSKGGKPGPDGKPGRTYFLEPSTLVIKRSKDNSTIPNFVDFQSFYRDGDKEERVAYTGRFKIEETKDGKTWNTVYISQGDESKVRHHIYTFLTNESGDLLFTESGYAVGFTRDIEAIRCTLYASKETQTELDVQMISVVRDVDNLTHEEIFNLFTNNGEIKGIFKEGNQLYINADYIATGILTDLNGNNYWNLETGEFKLSSTTTVGGETVQKIATDTANKIAKEESEKAVKSQTQEDIFNKLTNNGQVKGIVLKDGQLYVNADYINTGTLKIGGSNNKYGIIKIYDTNGSEIGLWDNSRLFMNDKKEGKSVELKTGSLEFIGKNGKYTKISQVDELNISTFGHISFTVQNVGDAFQHACYIMNPAGSIPTHSFTGKALFNPGLESENIIATNISGVNKITASYLYASRIYFPKAGALYIGYATGTENRIHVQGGIQCVGDFVAQGTKSRNVNTKSYNNRLLYCYEMSSPMFGDIGEGIVDESGTCYIYLDDIFVETVSTEIEYQVFLQKEGQGNLWVDSKEPTHFVVKGTTGLKFSWEIKAKQRDYEYERLEDTETTKNDVEIIDYEEQGQKLFIEYCLEKEDVQ